MALLLTVMVVDDVVIQDLGGRLFTGTAGVTPAVNVDLELNHSKSELAESDDLWDAVLAADVELTRTPGGDPVLSPEDYLPRADQGGLTVTRSDVTYSGVTKNLITRIDYANGDYKTIEYDSDWRVSGTTEVFGGISVSYTISYDVNGSVLSKTRSP